MTLSAILKGPKARLQVGVKAIKDHGHMVHMVAANPLQWSAKVWVGKTWGVVRPKRCRFSLRNRALIRSKGMKTTYFTYAGTHYSASRTFDGILLLCKEKCWRVPGGQHFRGWTEMGPKEEAPILRRFALEAMGMTEERRITILDGAPFTPGPFGVAS